MTRALVTMRGTAQVTPRTQSWLSLTRQRDKDVRGQQACEIQASHCRQRYCLWLVHANLEAWVMDQSAVLKGVFRIQKSHLSSMRWHAAAQWSAASMLQVYWS